MESGKDYTTLPESYIIFVCNYDYFGTGKAVSKRKPVIEGREDIVYEDGSHFYLLNSQYKERNASQAILEYLNCIRENNVENAYESALMKAVCPAVKSVRASAEKKEEYMTLQAVLMDERRVAKQEGILEGALKNAKESAERMMKSGKLSLEEVAEFVPALSLDELKNLKLKLGN